MKTARLAVLGVALAAGLGAAYVMMGTKEPIQQVRIAAPPPPTDAVLVAAHDLNVGAVVAADDMRWQPWPGQIPPGFIARSLQPNGPDQLKGLRVRASFSVGDPLRLDRFGKGNSMSAVLPSGMRAIAIDLADQGKSAAGGFILPNDRVDVVHTFHPDNAPMTNFHSETIINNVLVLAIGQAVQGKDGEQNIIGGTATLQMTPAQVEKVMLAQRTGQLTLALRSTVDSAQIDVDKPPEDPPSLTIIRSGNASQTQTK